MSIWCRVAVSARAGKELWCRSQFQLVQTRSIWCRVAVSACAGKERWCRSQFQLVQTRSMCCSFSSCRQGALVLPFMLVQTRSVGVAFYARADQERCAMQFRLMQAMSFVSCSLGSYRQGALCHTV
ncbi:hypothetical protein ACFX2F_015723 [Malus domestica]